MGCFAHSGRIRDTEQTSLSRARCPPRRPALSSQTKEVGLEFLVEWLWPEPDGKQGAREFRVADDTERAAVLGKLCARTRPVGQSITIAGPDIFVKRAKVCDRGLKFREGPGLNVPRDGLLDGEDKISRADPVEVLDLEPLGNIGERRTRLDARTEVEAGHIYLEDMAPALQSDAVEREFGVPCAHRRHE